MVERGWTSPDSAWPRRTCRRTISVDRVVETTGTNTGPVALRQIRELIADLLGL